MEPTFIELSCIVNNLEELGDLPNLWKAVADKFHRANKDNPDSFEYWRKVRMVEQMFFSFTVFDKQLFIAFSGLLPHYQHCFGQERSYRIHRDKSRWHIIRFTSTMQLEQVGSKNITAETTIKSVKFVYTTRFKHNLVLPNLSGIV